jgi:hypothetical protein
MYDGVKAMIKAEKELISGTQVGSHLKSAEELIGMPIFPAGTKSLLAKHLTKDIWEKY